jgi:hypothetical protein
VHVYITPTGRCQPPIAAAPAQHPSLLPPSPHHPPPTTPQTVTGYGEAGQALVTSPDVGKLIFVGSTQIGRKVGLCV